ncbi:MAG: hypothetical protein WB765_04210 [Acidimicrobiales bacterium]|jgi:hypothetical protein
MNALEVTEKVQDGVIKAIETSQGWTLGAVQSTTSTFDTFRPDLSSMPFADMMPTPGETVDATFSFVGRLLEAQHAFLSSLVGITAPAPARAPVAKKAA